MPNSWFDLIVLLGICQGVICGALILYRNGLGVEQRLLVAIILVLCGLGFKILLHTLGLWNTLAFRYFPLAIDLLVQPLLFLYVLSLTTPDFRLAGNRLLHFVPPAVFIGHALVVYFAVQPVSGLYEKDLVAEGMHYNLVKKIEDVLSVLGGIAYGALCLWRLRAYRSWLERSVSDTTFPALVWLRNLLIATAILGLGVCVNLLLDSYIPGRPWFFRWQLFYLYLVFLIYYLAFKGLLGAGGRVAVLPEMVTGVLEPAGKFTQTELEEAMKVIIIGMEQKRLYLDGELTLQKLSNGLELSPALVSAAINRCAGKSFRTMVNEYRIAEVKLRLVDPAYAHLSMLGIALDCGFNSEASFYRLFKEATGGSPREFVKENRNP